jgi:nitrogen regulatory protein P-II 2
METVSLKLVTVVAEAVLADSLINTLKGLGASGYTLTEVRGEGSRGRRVGELPGDNVRVEVLVTPAVAGQILECISAKLFPNYAVVAWTTDVHVVRGEKYA